MSDAFGINALALLIPILSVTLSLGAVHRLDPGVASAQGARGRMPPQGAHGRDREGPRAAAGTAPAGGADAPARTLICCGA